MARDVDRKKLWGRSGSRCAICNAELTTLDGLDSIVGDEAHIRARNTGGPRHDLEYPPEKVNSYENLILVCKPHHKLIDDNWEVFTVDLLEEIKNRHESRVRSSLNGPEGNWVREPDIARLNTGTDVVDVVMGSSAYFLSTDHPGGDAEAELIGGFLQEAQDWADIAGDVGTKGRVDAAMSLHSQVVELGSRGLAVVGGRGEYRLAKDLVVPASVLRVIRPAHG